MAEVVSDSEPSPLEALRTGLNMAAALALADVTSGTGIPPRKQRNNKHFIVFKDADRTGFRKIHLNFIAPQDLSERNGQTCLTRQTNQLKNE